MLKKSVKKLVCYMVSIAMLASMLVFSSPVVRAQADEFDIMRDKIEVMLTGGTGYDTSDSNIAAAINRVTATAQSHWDSMNKSQDRTYLWSDLASTTVSSHITSIYGRLKSMAVAYSTFGSPLHNNSALLEDIIDALDWMNSNRYYQGKTKYDNWWDWEIGAPLALNDTVVLLYDNLSSGQISNYMNAVSYFTPNVTMTGENRVWKSTVVGVRGIIVKDGTKVSESRDGLSDVFNYVTSGEGFYADGSFIQHMAYPYNGGYGRGVISDTSNLMQILSGSTYEVTDPDKDNIFKWVYDSYEMFIYKGAMMDMVRGRDISRNYAQDHAASHIVLSGIIRISQFAPPSDASAYKSMVKYWLETDTYNSFFTDASVEMIVHANAILNDTNIASRGELLKYRQYPGMDRAVQLRPGYGFGISMHSNRIGNYESINNENLKGWHTSDGMTYLYNNDLSQFSDNFWPTVNSYRLPGTTVLKDTAADAALFGDTNWVGGTDILGLYGVTGMLLHTNRQNLTAKKSWFTFDDEIVALGSDIDSTDNKIAETIVENRKLNSSGNNQLTVNGTVKPDSLGWSETMTDTNWIHLAGNVSGSDIGYYFPGTATINGLRESRTGSWKELNNRSTTPTTQYTNNYLNLWLDHGTNPTDASYSYVLLPNKTSAQVSSYASSPDITILENSPDAQAVKENGLNIIGANFWNDAVKTVDIITSNKKAAVMTKETVNDIEVSVSDPTQYNNGSIHIEINKSATGLIAADDGITVTQYYPTIKFTVNVNGAKGRTFKVKFNLSGNATPNPTPVPTPTPTPAPPTEVIVDNTYGNGFTSETVWGTNVVSSGYYGADYCTDGTSGADMTNWAMWTPEIGWPGNYDVYMRWTSHANRPDAAPVQIKYNGGIDTSKTVNQQTNGGTWVLIGNYNLSLGRENYVKILSTDAGYTVADAVKFVPGLTGECESLTRRLSGATETNFTDVNLSSGAGNKLNADGVGDYVEYDINIPTSGTYNIKINVKKHSARGKFQLYLPQDNVYVGVEQDQYNPTDSFAELDLGNYTFATSGTKQFRLVVTGKNESSSGYTLANDCIRLTPQ